MKSINVMWYNKPTNVCTVVAPKNNDMFDK